MMRLPFSPADACMFVQPEGGSPFTLEFIASFHAPVLLRLTFLRLQRSARQLGVDAGHGFEL